RDRFDMALDLTPLLSGALNRVETINARERANQAAVASELESAVLFGDSGLDGGKDETRERYLGSPVQSDVCRIKTPLCLPVHPEVALSTQLLEHWVGVRGGDRSAEEFSDVLVRKERISKRLEEFAYLLPQAQVGAFAQDRRRLTLISLEHRLQHVAHS